jgi:hypothetical protein
MGTEVRRNIETTRYRPVEEKKPIKKPEPVRTATTDADPPASTPSTTTATPSRSTPTLRTSLEGRAAHAANSGGNFRAFQLQQIFDRRTAPTSPAPVPTATPEGAPSPIPTDKVELTPEQEAAQATYERLSNRTALQNEIQARGGDLSGMSDQEMQALAALSIDHPELQATIRDATIATVDNAESLEDVPSSVGFQHLLDTFVLNPSEEHDLAEGQVNARVDYSLMVDAEIERLLDNRLEGARGDGELEDSLERFTGDLEDFVFDQPAAAQFIESTTRDLFEERGERFQDIQRADDPWYSDVGHFVSDGVRSLASGLADAIFPDTGGGNRPYFGPYSDFFNNPLVQEARNFGAGFNMAGRGSIEGFAELVADPIGSARALVEVVKDPSLLLAGYREAAELYGPSGAAGAIGFDLMTAAVGAAALPSGISAGALRTLSRVGGVLDNLPFGNRLSRGLLDEVGELTEARRFNDLPTSLQDDILNAIGRNPADEAGRRALIGLVDSDAFGGLDLPEQQRLVRYVGGENPFVSGPARAQLQDLVNDPNYQALTPDQQADRLRRFTAEESPSYILEPPTGTFRPQVAADIGTGQAVTHPFSAGGNAAARRFNVDIDGRNVEIIVPDNMLPGAGSQHTLQQVVDGLRSMPEANRRAVDRIILEPGPDPSNGLYSSGANSYMTAGADGAIRIYPTETGQSFDALASSMVHETGHTLTHREWGAPTVQNAPDGTIRFNYQSPEWTRYAEAAEADGVLPSGYAAVDIGEDAAETMRLYSMVQGTPFEAEIRAIYSNRFEVLDELLGGG